MSNLPEIAGVVTRFDSVKRFGFIQPADGSPQLFFRIDSVVNRLADLCNGAVVKFRIGDDGTTKWAEHIRVMAVPRDTPLHNLHD